MLSCSSVRVSAAMLLLAMAMSANLPFLLAESQDIDGHSKSNLKGHMEPFGASGVHLKIEERSDFPEPADFIKEFVNELKPVKFTGVFRDTRAVRQWTDDYLLQLDVPLDTEVKLETMKKEDRSQETTAMHFHEFLRIYNRTEYYMVDDVPPYLRPDLNVPCSLQCPEIVKDGFAFALMWFSSGGTKSVVHTDAFDNINCLIRGQKSFVMLDPQRDRDKIDISHSGAFSKVDVDSVDLIEYPGLAEAEFYHINMTAGDCLYIPYRWIHQVRSFNSNVAVNFWWDHYAFSKSKLGDNFCTGHCDPSLTLDNINVRGIDAVLEDTEGVRDWLTDATMNGPIKFEDLIDIFKGSAELAPELDSEEENKVAEDLIKEAFKLLDYNGDETFTTEDAEQIPLKTWEKIKDLTNTFSDMFENEEGLSEEKLAAERREYAKWEAEHREEL